MKYSSFNKKFRLTKIAISRANLIETQKYLREYGSRNCEGMVFWSGIKRNGEAIIRSCINPKQICTAASVDISPEETQRINILLAKKSEVLIAQVHTHPGVAFHSSRDDSMPATYIIGFLSLVVPYFCEQDINSFSGLVICEYVGSGEWKELNNHEISKRFKIINSN